MNTGTAPERDFCRNQRWSRLVFSRAIRARAWSAPLPIGILKGEGIGPEVVEAALGVLRAIESCGPIRFALRAGGAIGRAAEELSGTPLTAEVVDFCRQVFAEEGAVLAGPGGGRFVYDLRRQFDLFCKLSPLRVSEELIRDTRFKPESLRNVDVLLVRENVAGVYQGRWTETTDAEGLRQAEHTFAYTEPEVRRILDVAARIAGQRRGILDVVVKEGGVPSVSRLWRDCAAEIARVTGVRCRTLNVDLAAYLLVQHPQDFDVLATPNLFGDILADLGGVLLGSRALSFSGNFSRSGAAVYQTNHGAAYDLAGTDRANPAGQIFSLAMLLRESFGLVEEAGRIEAAVAEVWRQGFRTADLAASGQRAIGTREMGERVAEEIVRRSGREMLHETGNLADRSAA